MNVKNTLNNRGKAVVYLLLGAIPVLILAAILLLKCNKIEHAKKIFADKYSTETEKLKTLQQLQTCINNKHTTDFENLSKIIATAIEDKSEKVTELAIQIAESQKLTETSHSLLKRISDNQTSIQLREKACIAAKKIDFHINDPIISGKMALLITDRKLLPELRNNLIQMSDKFWNDKILDSLFTVAKEKEESTALRLKALDKAGEKLVVGSRYLNDLFMLYSDENELIALKAQNVLKKVRNRESIFNFYGYGNVINKAMKGVSEIQAANAQHQQQLMDMMDEMHGGKKPEKDPIEKIAENLNSGNIETIMLAIYDLGELKDEKALPFLDKLAQKQNKGRIQFMLAKAYEKINSKKSLPVLLKLAETSHYRSKPAFFKAMETISGKNFGQNIEKWKAFING